MAARKGKARRDRRQRRRRPGQRRRPSLPIIPRANAPSAPPPNPTRRRAPTVRNRKKGARGAATAASMRDRPKAARRQAKKPCCRRAGRRRQRQRQRQRRRPSASASPPPDVGPKRSWSLGPTPWPNGPAYILGVSPSILLWRKERGARRSKSCRSTARRRAAWTPFFAGASKRRPWPTKRRGAKRWLGAWPATHRTDRMTGACRRRPCRCWRWRKGNGASKARRRKKALGFSRTHGPTRSPILSAARPPHAPHAPPSRTRAHARRPNIRTGRVRALPAPGRAPTSPTPSRFLFPTRPRPSAPSAGNPPPFAAPNRAARPQRAQTAPRQAQPGRRPRRRSRKTKAFSTPDPPARPATKKLTVGEQKPRSRAPPRPPPHSAPRPAPFPAPTGAERRP